MNNEKIKPLFKYIGGKSWLGKELRENVKVILEHNHIEKYVEPFAGGLGAFLSIQDILKEKSIHDIYLSDINSILIEIYKNIQNNPKSLISEYEKLEINFFKSVPNEYSLDKSKDEQKQMLKEAEKQFKEVKVDFNKNKNLINVKQCANLIFLQKHSFNGIYRENSKGEYNTPFNWSGANMLNSISERVKELNTLFNSFNINFETKTFDIINYENTNTLYYLDPPYINDGLGENKYNKDTFGIEQQLLLIEKILPTHFIYSNHKSEVLINEFNKNEKIFIKEISRKNIMSAKKETRANDKMEILVRKFVGDENEK